MIIFAGDIGNMASGFAYDTYKAAFKSVSAKNSDYSKHNGQSRLLRLKDAGKLQAAFTKKSAHRRLLTIR